QIVKMKQNLRDGVDTVQNIVGNYIESQKLHILRSIDAKIHAFYQAQAKILANPAYSNYKIMIKKQTTTGLVTSWDVIYQRVFANSLSFRFRVVDSESLHDE